MKRALLLLLLLGCEPGKRNQAAEFALGLQDIHQWDPHKQALGFYAYDEMLRLPVEESAPVLIEHLTDTTETKIMDMADITVPTVGDVCFHILLRLYAMEPLDFRREGVVVLPGVDNPIFAVRFDPGARVRVQKRFREILSE